MRVLRHLKTQRLEQEQMSESIFHMVVAAHDMRHPLRDIVANVRQVEHRAGIAADDDKILDAVQRLAQLAFDQVVVKHFAANEGEISRAGDLFRLDRGGDPGQSRGIQLEQHRAVRGKNLQVLEPGQTGGIFHRLALMVDRGPDESGTGERDLRFRRDLSPGFADRADKRIGIAVIRQPEQHRRSRFGRIQLVGMASLNQLLRRLTVRLALRGLIHRFAVIIQAQPVHAVEQRVDGLFGGTLQVGIFDPQQKFTAAVTGVKPVENGGPDIADMDLSRRGRCKSCSETHC